MVIIVPMETACPQAVEEPARGRAGSRTKPPPRRDGRRLLCVGQGFFFVIPSAVEESLNILSPKNHRQNNRKRRLGCARHDRMPRWNGALRLIALETACPRPWKNPARGRAGSRMTKTDTAAATCLGNRSRISAGNRRTFRSQLPRGSAASDRDKNEGCAE